MGNDSITPSGFGTGGIGDEGALALDDYTKSWLAGLGADDGFL